MTKNGNKTLTTKIVLFLTVLFLILSSVFMLTACGDENDSSNKEEAKITYPSVTKLEEETTDLIAFGDFENGNYNLTTTSFPSNSVNGWSTISKETNAPSSGYTYLSKSGIIDKDSWSTTLTNFKKDKEDVSFDDAKIFDATRKNRVLMLNAYCKENLATAVKATRSSSITLDKNSLYAISVDVLTTSLSIHSGEGANIQLVSSVNGTSRTNGIYGINTSGEWKTFTFYLTTDEYVSTNVKLSLGLGRAGKSIDDISTCVEGGSAFFDNVKIEKIDAVASGITPTALTYNYNSDNTLSNANSDISFAIDYSISPVFTGTFNTTNKQVDLGNYYVVKAVASNDDTVTVNQYQGDSQTFATSKKIELKKDDIYYFIVKNNYPTATASPIKQWFNLEINNNAVELTCANGLIDEENDDYKLYSSLAKETIALYNGYNADYVKPTTSEGTFAFNPAKTETLYNKSEIDFTTKFPAKIKNFKGITNNSIYLPGDSTVSEFDQNKNAGLVKDTVDGKDIQAIIISNDGVTYKNYGFIGTNYSINASSYATVSLKVKVETTASAFIYIIDNDTNLPMVWENGENKKEISMSVSNCEWKTLNFYIATGNTAKSFRVEMWNGSRDGATQSTGTVYFDELNVNTSAQTFESARIEDLFISGTLSDELFDDSNKISYTRQLTEQEVAFNKEYADKAVSYSENYVWANNDKTIYAVYNTIDPVVVDPYDSVKDETETDEEEKANNNGSFWLSFSSIALVAVMILALIALVVKNYLTKKKLNANDAVSHYTIQSKTSKKKKENKVVKNTTEKVEEPSEDSTVEESEEVEENVEEVVEENNEQPSEENNETLDEYVYGDVQDFGENLETNEEKIETENEPSTEETNENETTDKE